ncbi:ABC transporter permease [Thermosediminibacter litoriperuensis]|uniref:ABC-2 type transport system permease protein n=1 Tax=Thermosediminibacter litoriperuensis TaxID=291989 RepID=A0A5S5ATL3_9FIRM|nr:ABC transporter permease [Thermosediminibacter litoriperuensis]TYP55448.1 ABC-2 type transport system permease protein [Thermosediminibacter litoriperuensis]
MRRIWAIFCRDLSSSMREFLLLYMIFAPIFLALLFRIFISSAGSAALMFAVDERVGEDVIGTFKKYGSVEVYKNVEEIKRRVAGADDVAGITINESGDYIVILDGGETHDTREIPKMIIRDMVDPRQLEISFSVRDLGVTRSPVARVGAASLILTVFALAGAVIGFNIIEEKEGKTLSAINVTPVRRFEFIAGKSITGLAVSIMIVYPVLWILDMWSVDKAKIFAMTLSSSAITILAGFLIGAMSGNQVEGIANLKVSMLPLSASVVGALMLPPDKHFFVSWIPTYWSFKGFDEIIKNSASWGQIGIYSAWILGLVLAAFLVLSKRIKRGIA